MRYTFQQLLEYQNKRNAECDQSKVDNVVDDVLAQLEDYVHTYPATKELNIYRFTQRENRWANSVATLTQVERNKVIETLSDLGFREPKFVTNNEEDATHIRISWE